MKIYYTNDGNQKDGFGAQYQKIIYTILYCKFNNLEFIYTPFSNMEHNYDNDTNFIQKKENLINLINHFPVITNEIKNNNKINTLFFNDIRDFIENNITDILQSDQIKEIRNIFWENKNRNIIFDNNNIHIGIHIRRPNVQDNRLDGSDTPHNYYLKVINLIYNKYKIITNKKLVFHIYSQGNSNDFIIYKNILDINTNNTEVVYHLNESIEKTFIEMVKTDVLILSRSSFSYIAAFLNEGEIYYQPFWHKPSNHWHITQ